MQHALCFTRKTFRKPYLRDFRLSQRSWRRLKFCWVPCFHPFMVFYFHFLSLCIWLYVLYTFVQFSKLCIFIVMFMYSYYHVYVFVLLCMFYSVYSVSLCCSVYCLCVNVYCTTATRYQPYCR